MIRPPPRSTLFPTRRSSDLCHCGAARSTPLGCGPAAHLSMGTTQSASRDRKSTRLNSSHMSISYAVFCLKKKKNKQYLVNKYEMLLQVAHHDLYNLKTHYSL